MFDHIKLQHKGLRCSWTSALKLINHQQESNYPLIFQDGVSIATVTANGSGNWSYSHPGLADGDYDFTTVATDVYTNVSATSATQSVHIDATAPNAPTITPLTDGQEMALSMFLVVSGLLSTIGSATIVYRVRKQFSTPIARRKSRNSSSGNAGNRSKGGSKSYNRILQEINLDHS